MGHPKKEVKTLHLKSYLLFLFVVLVSCHQAPATESNTKTAIELLSSITGYAEWELGSSFADISLESFPGFTQE